MNTLRNFLIASAGTLGLLEVTNPENLLVANSEPQTVLIRMAISLLAGLLTAVASRLLGKWLGKNSNKKVHKNNNTKKH